LQNDGGTPNEFAANWGFTTIFNFTNSPGFGYTEYTFTVVANSNVEFLRFDFRQDPAWFHLDDVSVTALSAPDSGSTVVLLGAAMIVVGLLHRRTAAKRA
jgi:hypothetical protein